MLVDTTNREENCHRNKNSGLSIIPLMEENYPTVKENIFRMSTLIREDSHYIERIDEFLRIITLWLIYYRMNWIFLMLIYRSKRIVRYAINVVLHSLKGLKNCSASG